MEFQDKMERMLTSHLSIIMLKLTVNKFKKLFDYFNINQLYKTSSLQELNLIVLFPKYSTYIKHNIDRVILQLNDQYKLLN